MRFLKNSVLLGALSLAVSTSVPAQISSYHSVSGSGHQSRFNSLVSNGYRPLTMTVHGTYASPRYSAVWAKRSGSAWTGFHNLSISNYQTFYSTWTAKGYKPTIVSACGSGTSVRMIGMFVKTSASLASWHGMTEATFRNKCSWAQDNDYIPTCVSIYGTTTSPRYIAVFAKNTAKVRWNFGIDSSASGYQKRYNAYASVSVRPALVSSNNGNRYVSVWYDNKLTSGYITRHAMTATSYQSYSSSYEKSGYHPLWIESSGADAATRFAAIWVKSESVKGRSWQVRGTAVKALGGFDSWMKSFMVTGAIRAGSIAVVRDGRLKLARAYTWAESGYPVTQPASTFRIAGMSKPLTSIAVHRAEQEHKLSTVDLVYKKLPTTPFLDNYNRSVRLTHLLSHTGGWNIDVLGFDPLFRDAVVAQKLGVSLPVNTSQIWKYMSQYQNLQFAPGTQGKHSNYGFSLLGRYLESVYGLSYESVVKAKIMTPLGIARPFIGGSKLAHRKAGEVYYHPRIPGIATTAVDGTGTWVPRQYGGWNQANLGASDGWVMAPADYAKVLAGFDAGDENPVLPKAAALSMWIPPFPNVTSALKGWFVRTVKDDKNISLAAYNHNGNLPGTASLCFRRTDGLSVVVVFNADPKAVLGGSHLSQLNTIANQVGVWPEHDLFPSLGIPTLGRFALFGDSCKTSESHPSHYGLGSPIAGKTITLGLKNAKPAKVGVLFLGGSNTHWNRMSLPLSLTPFGAPGCKLLVSPNIILARTIASTTGASQLQITLPANSALRGARVFSQYVLYDPKANPLGLAFTGGVETRIGG